MPFETVNYLLGMAGTVAFALTAVLAVAPKGIDIFGTTVLGVITAIGGGTVRDLILGVPVFWAGDLNYIWVALAASVVAFFAISLLSRKRIFSLMLYVDGIGAALFAVEATRKTWDLGFGLPLAPILLGIVTAIGGGLIRDVLAGRQTLLMSRELYAIPITLGCTLCVGVLYWFPERAFLGGIACILFIFCLRAAVIRWNLCVPEWLTTKSTSE